MSQPGGRSNSSKHRSPRLETPTLPLVLLFTTLWSAWAQQPDVERDDDWWHGLVVASVTLIAPAGDLPDENLQPLLRVTQGRRLTPQDVHTDLVTLYRVGSFSAVEAHVQPWFVFDPETGEDQPGALVNYEVYPAPIIERIRVHGNRAFSDRKLLDASGLGTGQVFYEDLDRAYVEERVEAWLRRRGYPTAAARVDMSALQGRPGRVFLVLDVDEGEPTIVSHIAFAGAWERTGVRERQLRRWVRRAGVREGRPLGPDDQRSAIDLIRERLGLDAPRAVPEKVRLHVGSGPRARPRREGRNPPDLHD